MGCCYDEGQKLLCSCCQRKTLVGTGKRFILQQGQREAITVCLHVPIKFNGTRSNISVSSNWHHASTSTLSATCWSVINKASDWSTLNVAEMRFNQPLFFFFLNMASVQKFCKNVIWETLCLAWLRRYCSCWWVRVKVVPPSWLTQFFIAALTWMHAEDCSGKAHFLWTALNFCLMSCQFFILLDLLAASCTHTFQPDNRCRVVGRVRYCQTTQQQRRLNKAFTRALKRRRQTPICQRGSRDEAQDRCLTSL